MSSPKPNSTSWSQECKPWLKERPGETPTAESEWESEGEDRVGPELFARLAWTRRAEWCWGGSSKAGESHCGRRTLTRGPAWFSVSCCQCWSAVCVSLPLISLRDDPWLWRWQPAFHYCKHTEIQMCLESWSLWTSGLCDRGKGQVNRTMIKLSPIVSVIRNSPASGLCPADEREPHCTPAQIIYHCPPNTQTIHRSPALLRLASSHDLSNTVEVLFSTWVPCPISCFTYHFPLSVRSSSAYLVYFYPDFSVHCNFSLLLPKSSGAPRARSVSEPSKDLFYLPHYNAGPRRGVNIA